jgi:hypothetical protein
LANPQPVAASSEFPNANANREFPVVGWVSSYRGITTGPQGARIGALPTSATIPNYPAWTVYPTTKAVRLRNGAAIGWGGIQAGSTRREGLTVVTPNGLYLWGNYNTAVDPAVAGGGYPPCAIFADGVSVLSNAWTSASDAIGTGNATSTRYNVSYAINNMPTDSDNITADASGGTHNAIRYLENWSNQTYTFFGSLVVLNRMRYSRGYCGGYYNPPIRALTFNADLLTQGGTPPFAPWGVQVTRVVSTLNQVNR